MNCGEWVNVYWHVPPLLHEAVAVTRSVTYPGVELVSEPKLVYPKSDAGPAMVSEREFEPLVKLLIGIPLPWLSLTVSVTVGFCPAPPFTTFTRLKFKPPIPGAWSGIV